MAKKRIRSGNGGGIIVNDAGNLLGGGRTSADPNLTIQSTVSLDGLTTDLMKQLVKHGGLNKFKVDGVDIDPATVTDFGVTCSQQPDQLTVQFATDSFSLSITRKMSKVTDGPPFKVYVLDDSGPVDSVHVTRKGTVKPIDRGDVEVEFHGKF